MLIRLLAILALALILSVIFFDSPSATQTQSSLLVLSPPAGLELPVGQGLEVRGQWQGEDRVRAEFLVDGVPLHTESIRPGGSAALAWLPTQTGSHILTIVLRVDGREVATTRRQVLVVPRGLPVRVP